MPGLPSTLEHAAAVAIFVATYLVLALGRLPGLRLDRAGAALLGASLMVACGALAPEAAYRAIDLDTITLLIGVMIVVANLRLSGFFRLVIAWAARKAGHPLTLLLAVTSSSGLFSAFLVNDTVCIVLTPLVLDLTRRLRRDPVPYLLAVAMAANIGSTATITGNPQNMLVGGFSAIPYARFTYALAPVAALGLLLTVIVIAVVHRREFLTRQRLLPHEDWRPARVHRPLAQKTVLVAALMVAAFFAGQPPATVAIVAGAVLLLTRMVKPEKVYREIDWPLILMFAGLFIVVAGFERAVLTPELVAAVGRLHLDSVPLLSLVTAVLSNLVSNVPAVLVLEPFIRPLADPERAWLTVAMASTLAGNLTLVGSVANLIVAQRARAQGITIGFWAHARVGVPLTILTILAGIWWLG